MFDGQVEPSEWIQVDTHLQPHSICSRTCSHWPSTLLLGPWRIPNSWPRTMKMASRQSAKRWKPCRKTAWSTSFLQVSLASCKYTHLAHVASLYDLTSCSHPFRYVFCIPVSIAVIDSDWRHWQWMMHGAHSMSGRDSAQSFSGRSSGEDGEHMCYRNTVTGKAHLRQTTFSFPTWYVTCLLFEVFGCAAESSQVRTATRLLSSLCWMRKQLPPLRSWSWSRYIMDQNCNGILPVVYWSILG